jgi:hypothetical protein
MVVMYTYHEGEGTRGQNYVASILLDYLTSNLTARVTVAERSEAGIVGSNPTQGMDV